MLVCVGASLAIHENLWCGLNFISLISFGNCLLACVTEYRLGLDFLPILNVSKMHVSNLLH